MRLPPFLIVVTLVTVCGQPIHAQDPPEVPQPPAHHHHSAASTWHVMQDGVAYLTFNDQGGPRGGRELSSQNWWMGMAQRRLKGGTFLVNLMLSLEPATLGKNGYREIFQAGETYKGAPLVDRQHPHEFLMQAAAGWQVDKGTNRFTFIGAAAGEPALGPVAFMHRRSAFENPTAPLGHHTFDSTHIAMGVLSAALERGPWHFEGSLFHGAEPDEQRWDLMDPGPLDSWSVRGWFRPNADWAFQISHGFLNEPEALEEGDVRRTTASASWTRNRGAGWDAATFVYGRNDKLESAFTAVLAETTHTFGRSAFYTRAETLQVETNLLRFGVHEFVGGRKAHVPDDVGGRDWVTAATLGGVRTLSRFAGWDVGAGGDVTFYGVPSILRPLYGDRPVSFHLYLRVRPPATARMTDMVMTRGMTNDE